MLMSKCRFTLAIATVGLLLTTLPGSCESASNVLSDTQMAAVYGRGPDCGNIALCDIDLECETFGSVCRSVSPDKWVKGDGMGGMVASKNDCGYKFIYSVYDCLIPVGGCGGKKVTWHPDCP